MKITIQRYYYFLPIIVLLFIGVARSEEIIKFNLTPDMIKDSWIYEDQDDQYGVHVSLNDESRQRFLEITKANIGKRLEIYFSGKLYTTAIIKTVISSGIINIRYLNSMNDAEILFKQLNKEKNIIVKLKPEKQLETSESTRKPVKKYLAAIMENYGNYKGTGEKAFLLKSLKLSEAAIKAHPDDCDAYYWKAMALAELGSYHKASSVLDDGIKQECQSLKTKIAVFYFLKGVIADKAMMKDNANKNYRLAISHYRNNLHHNPRDVDSLIGIGQALTLMDRKSEALELINKLINEYPHDPIMKEAYKVVESFDAKDYLKRVFSDRPM